MTREQTLRRLIELNEKLNDATLTALVGITQSLAANPTSRRPLPLKVTHARPPASVSDRHRLFFIATAAGDLISISTAGASLLHSTPDRLVGKNWIDLVDGHEEQKRIGERWLLASQTNQSFSYTARCRTALAGIVEVFVRLTACYDSDHQKVIFVGTMHALHSQAPPAARFGDARA